MTTEFLKSVLGLCFLLLIWILLAESGFVSSLILPSPLSVLKSSYSLFTNPIFLSDLQYTLYRIIVSFTISCLIGIPTGLLMGFYESIYKALIFLVDFFRSIPPIALFPVFILIFGIAESSKIAVPVYGCTLILVVNSIYGVTQTPRIRKDLALFYGLSKVQLFFKVIIPDAIPYIIVGMRTSISLAIVLTIVVEMLMGVHFGLGKRIQDFYLVFEIPQMYLLIIIIGLIGYSINKVFMAIEKKVFHWIS